MFNIGFLSVLAFSPLISSTFARPKTVNTPAVKKTTNDRYVFA